MRNPMKPTSSTTSPLDNWRGGPAVRTTNVVLLVVVLCALRAIVPSGLNYLQLPHFVHTGGGPEVRSSASRYATLALTVALLGYCALKLLSTRLPLRIFEPLPLALLSAFALDFARAGTHTSTHAVELVAGSLLIAVLSMFGTSDTHLSAIGAVGVGVAAYSIALALLDPAHAFMPRFDKQTFQFVAQLTGSRQLAGPFSHSNELGIAMAMSLPLVMSWRGRVRVTSVALLVTACVLSQSRTALIAVALCFLYLVLWRALPKGGRRAAAYGVVGAAAIFVVAVPLGFALTSSDLSGRAEVWRDGIAAWREHGAPLFGIGPYWSSRVGQLTPSGLVRTSSGHNLFVQWLVVGGYAQAALGTILIFVACRKAVRSDLPRALPRSSAFMLTLVFISTTEYCAVPSIASELFASVMLVVVIILFANREPSRAAPAPTIGSSRLRHGRSW